MVITSMKLVFAEPLDDGPYITTSKDLPFALWTVVSVIFVCLLRSVYDSSPIAIKSKSPSKVGSSKVRYSLICVFTDTAVENHSAPFETHNG